MSCYGLSQLGSDLSLIRNVRARIGQTKVQVTSQFNQCEWMTLLYSNSSSWFQQCWIVWKVTVTSHFYINILSSSKGIIMSFFKASKKTFLLWRYLMYYTECIKMIGNPEYRICKWQNIPWGPIQRLLLLRSLCLKSTPKYGLFRVWNGFFSAFQ